MSAEARARAEAEAMRKVWTEAVKAAGGTPAPDYFTKWDRPHDCPSAAGWLAVATAALDARDGLVRELVERLEAAAGICHEQARERGFPHAERIENCKHVYCVDWRAALARAREGRP